MVKRDCSCELRAHFQQSPVVETANTWEYEHIALGKVGTAHVTLGRITVKFLLRSFEKIYAPKK